MNAVEIYEKASWDLEHSKITLGEFEERIKPLYDVEPVRHGWWVEDEYEIPHCSECKAINNTVYRNYCSNCGARMGGESDE